MPSMPSNLRFRRPAPRISALASSVAVAVFALVAGASSSWAQEPPFWDQNDNSARSAPRSSARRDDALRAPENGNGPPGGFGQQADMSGQPYDGRAPAYPSAPPYNQGSSGYGAPRYGQYNSQPPAYGSQPPASPDYNSQGYGGGAPPYGNGGYASQGGQGGQGGYGNGGSSYGSGGGYAAQAPRGGNDAYQPPRQGAGYEGGGNDAYRPGGTPGYSPGYSDSNSGYGQPYAPPPDPNAGPEGRYGQAYGDDRRQWDDRHGGNTYSQNEVIDTGHRFFGSVSQGIASAIESVFKRQGRPNGYILGEDAGGAIVAGLRYGEGVLSTKDAGTHRVYWQGPSLGYDFGGEGSKTMVLVYNLRDPSDIYRRFGGVQGSAYLIGGVSVQLQAHEGITLAVIRSGVGLRLGANVGYLKYTRNPTWNPF